MNPLDLSEPDGAGESKPNLDASVLDEAIKPKRHVVEVTTPSGLADELNFYLPSHLGNFPLEADAVVLYEGPVVLHIDGADFEGEGEVRCVFSPNFALTFFAKSDTAPLSSVIGERENSPITLKMVSLERTVNVIVTKSHHQIVGPNPEFWARGLVEGDTASFAMLKPDLKPEPICRARFHLFNFQNYSGTSLFATTSVSRNQWLGRVQTYFGDWALTLDALPDIKERH